MKRYLSTYNDRVFKLEGLLYIGETTDLYPSELTNRTKFDEDGKPLPSFTFTIVYENGSSISPIYEEIEEASQDREQIVKELNDER